MYRKFREFPCSTNVHDFIEMFITWLGISQQRAFLMLVRTAQSVSEISKRSLVYHVVFTMTYDFFVPEIFKGHFTAMLLSCGIGYLNPFEILLSLIYLLWLLVHIFLDQVALPSTLVSQLSKLPWKRFYLTLLQHLWPLDHHSRRLCNRAKDSLPWMMPLPKQMYFVLYWNISCRGALSGGGGFIMQFDS